MVQTATPVIQAARALAVEGKDEEALLEEGRIAKAKGKDGVELVIYDANLAKARASLLLEETALVTPASEHGWQRSPVSRVLFVVCKRLRLCAPARAVADDQATSWELPRTNVYNYAIKHARASIVLCEHGPYDA